MLESITNIVLLVLGFGFVIFFHELGHFLAAKWCDVKVEQFAVGFGHALLSWRKGMGWVWGSSGKRYEQILKGEVEGAGKVDPAQVGETEYRLNWIPLGGYVKMLGQDDLRPNAVADDPRAYNRKSVGQRMVIVSAGVIMNIILAAIGFMVVFLMGFNAPPSVVGAVLPGSPAQQTRLVNSDGTPGAPAPLQVGDRILMFDGTYMHDFTKIMLSTALANAEKETLAYVERTDGTRERLYITPRRSDGDSKGFLALGVVQPQELTGPAKREQIPEKYANAKYYLPQTLLMQSGDRIVAVNGQSVQAGRTDEEKGNRDEYYKLDRALQASAGRPVPVTIENAQGQRREASVQPLFQRRFDGEPIDFAGMLMRPRVERVLEESTVVGKVLPGDVIVSIADNDGTYSNLTIDDLIGHLTTAGARGVKVTLTIEREGQTVVIPDVSASIKTSKKPLRYGIGIAPGFDVLNPVVAGTVDNSPAKAAGIPAGATIVSINAEKVGNWFDVKRVLERVAPEQPVTVVAAKDGKEQAYTLKLTGEQIATIGGYNYTQALHLHERREPRQTNNPLVAMQWGIVETRDFVLQFYVTIQRMFQGSVSYKNMMGPVGIFAAGSQFAYKGTDWLIWFLAMISANLAVVNFLPIPIVDGGLFTFLIIEKIQGRPISPRTQSIAQIVGLALILGVFLLVTYQDIARIGGY